MQSQMTKQKLSLVLSMLETKQNSRQLKLEEAKLKVLLNDPAPDITNELRLLNQGKISEMFISIIDRFILIPTLRKIFTR
ncbi:hypothetical protein [Campylobacter suis]|uniref:Uncharacterized protein n=1 Tax=Campylobacter suis TaxID=2790657 RepID=A0ABM8Q3C9_9BACT|nr:hypothetical protein [Campylobacter suis]CAD7287247.1 hypothetical protein LMG8286_00885 [Campylobacter suis]